MLTKLNPIKEGFFSSDLSLEKTFTHSHNQPPTYQNTHTHTTRQPQKQPPQTHTHTKTHTHTHWANLTDSSTALIADLNRPGDLSLSLTYTQHTSFFFHPLFLPLPLLLLSSFFPKYPSIPPCVTLHQLITTPLPSPIILPEIALSSFVSQNIGVTSSTLHTDGGIALLSAAVFKYDYISWCL